MPHELGGWLIVISLVGVLMCWRIAVVVDKQRERERESMKRAAGQWKDRDAYDHHVRGESDEQRT